jgi:O-antigen/teichoic acid export membrane protein
MTGGHQQRIVSRFLSYLNPVVKRNPYASRAIGFILNNPLYKGVLILGSGTAVAQLIGIVSMPIITRLYTPYDLGILAVYSSVLIITCIGATLRYEFALGLPERDEDAANLLGLCLILLLATTASFALILLFGGELLINTFNLNSIERYLWFLLVGFFGMGLYTILSYWAVRQRDYKRITYTKFNQSAGGSLCKILLGMFSFGPMGLILGDIVSQTAGISAFAHAMWRSERGYFKAISLGGMKKIARTYKSFPIFNFPYSILNSISLQLPSLMLLTLYDARTVGLYALAYTLMVLPGSIISGSIGQAYLGEASKMVREGSRELRFLYVRTLKHLLMIAVPLICILALCAPLVVPILFGEVWVEAGWFCWPLALTVIGSFVVGSTTNLPIYGYNHWMLIWDAIRFIGVLLGFYMCQLLGVTVVVTLLIYSIIMALTYLLNVILNLKAISNYNMKLT